MNYSFGSHYDNFIQEQVQNGRFKTEDDVIIAGLKIIEEHEHKLKALKAEIEEGIKQADEGLLYTLEEVEEYIDRELGL